MVQPGTPATQRAGSADYVSQYLDDLRRQIREIGPALMAAVGPAIADLQTQQATLTTTVADLATTQADLSAAVADLTTAQANIATLVGEQVDGDTDNASTGATAVAISTSLANYATITFTVPSGYTRAKVKASSYLAMSSAVSINMRTRINGVDGTTMPVLANSSGFGNGASGYAASRDRA